MAISATTNWEVRTTGVDTNGGGYSSGGTDYSQQNAAQIALTDAVAVGTTTITSASALFTAAMVGNTAYMVGGTGPLAATRVQITAFTNSTTVTIDTSIAAGTGITFNLGGACLTAAEPTTRGLVAGNTVYIKAGTYTLTATWNNAFVGAQGANTYYISYNSSRNILNTDSTRALITTATNSVPLITHNAAVSIIWRNIDFSNTAGTSSTGFTNVTAASTGLEWQNCSFTGFTIGISGASSTGGFGTPNIRECYFKSNTTAGFQSTGSNAANFINCYFLSNVDGIKYTSTTATPACNNCIFDTNTGYGINLTRTTTPGSAPTAVNCIFYNNTLGGIHNAQTTGTFKYIYFNNNIFYGGAYGVKFDSAGFDGAAVTYSNNYNAYGNQGTAATLNFAQGPNDITLTADPFVSGSGHNFALNSTTGGGALLRAKAYPQSFISSSTNQYLDVGAAQHQDSGSGFFIQ